MKFDTVIVLGAGSNLTVTDISTTINQGTVKNAGFKLVPTSETASDAALKRAKAVTSFVSIFSEIFFGICKAFFISSFTKK